MPRAAEGPRRQQLHSGRRHHTARWAVLTEYQARNGIHTGIFVTAAWALLKGQPEVNASAHVAGPDTIAGSGAASASLCTDLPLPSPGPRARTSALPSKVQSPGPPPASIPTLCRPPSPGISLSPAGATAPSSGPSFPYSNMQAFYFFTPGALSVFRNPSISTKFSNTLERNCS